MTGIGGVSAPWLAVVSATGRKGVSATGGRGVSATGSSGVSATGRRGVSATGSREVSATGSRWVSATGSRGVSATVASAEDDIRVDYMSMLDTEEKRQRFSEEVQDMDLKDSLRLQKKFRQLQRQAYCGPRKKVSNE